MPLYGSVDLSMAQAPSSSRGTSPTEGQLYYDTDDDVLYAYNGTNWKSITEGSGSGGAYTTYNSGYTVNTFLSDGTFTVTNGTLTCDILVVAGGGGGGTDAGGGWGGGGGAGGMVISRAVNMSSGTYTITVGAGGGAQTVGSDSACGTIIAYGGGGGGLNAGNAGNGGSGGGGGKEGGAAGEGIAGQGYDGMVGTGLAGGGGGAGAAATDENGGIGKTNDFRTGSDVYYAGGGGSGNPGTGGSGGGAAGANGSPNPAYSGTANTGGGGGGARSSITGGSGGSGIVVIRYAA